jgi:NAD(P)-dependent dehydrogenase (short-subunit alcohol dehydrogenase family)
MTNRLTDKVCVITGTGGSVGREAALTFAREGALVVGCGLHAEDAEATVAAVRAAGGPCPTRRPRRGSSA